MKKYKYSVVTTNFGDYEQIQEVKNPREDVEYVLVTDNPNLKFNTWKTVIFDDYDKLISPALAWIYVKFFTFNYCSSDVCLYKDGSIKIIDDFTELVDYFLDNNYEYAATIESNYTSPRDMLTQWGERHIYDYSMEIATQVMDSLNNSGYSAETMGMLNTSFLLKRKTEFTQKIDKDTWENLGSYNAGIMGYRVMEPAFSFSLYKNAYHSDKLLILDHDIKWSRWFIWCFHNSTVSACTLYNRMMPFYFQCDRRWVFQKEIVRPVSYEDIVFRKEKTPLLTVVITAYNKQNTIKRAINSVKQMSYDNWECIIVDNDSEDNTANVILDAIEYDTRFVYVRQRNKHLCNSRNVGMNMGSGKYLIHLDGDDTLGKNFCKYAIAELEKNETICIATGVFRRVYLNGSCNNQITSAGDFNSFTPEGRIYYELRLNYFAVESVYRMSILKQINGFREGIEEFPEDAEMIIRYFNAAYPNNDVYYIASENTATLYEQKNSKSAEYKTTQKENVLKFYELNKEIYDKYMSKEDFDELTK